jgi:beta-phosphoglucomutase-like phosphatase (HAD superfamily)
MANPVWKEFPRRRTVGAIAFDLDMTLVDSRPVSERALARLVSEYGVDLDVQALMSTYGLPLSRWLPPDVDATLFRTVQSQHISSVVPMPGAGLAVERIDARHLSETIPTTCPPHVRLARLPSAWQLGRRHRSAPTFSSRPAGNFRPG